MKYSKKFNKAEYRRLTKGKGFKAILKAVCGEKLGEGAHRITYVYKKNPNFVIKVMKPSAFGSFSNSTEFRNYVNFKDWNWFGKYLAPVELINETGVILVQRRVEFREKKHYPKKVPILFTDIKRQNFGWIDDQFVCCDYAYLLTLIVKKTSSRYKNVSWHRKF